ncbi:hypothetical protein B0H14DRAFT_2793731 [Mycena olivaceomarginata]|nr:hypothetical protein B0H14DRAFT_2793731 [Mycena olivaceomarginata]
MENSNSPPASPSADLETFDEVSPEPLDTGFFESLPPPPPSNLWPAGMGPPLSPMAAAALAMQERGLSTAAAAALAMQETGPTMAIDPALNLDIPFAPQLIVNPVPVITAPVVTAPVVTTPVVTARIVAVPQAPVFPRPIAKPVPIFTAPKVPVAPQPIVNPAPVVTGPVITGPVVTAPVVPIVEAATEPAKRKGRPPKAAAAVLTDTTNTQGGESEEQGVVVYCHGVGDNRKAAKAAAAQAKAAERKVAADALAAQRAKGWIHGPDGSVVLLRARKPARNPDGSARDCKGTRAPQLDETEKAMLARADVVRAENEGLKKGKRKAPASSAAPAVAKRRRTTA